MGVCSKCQVSDSEVKFREGNRACCLQCHDAQRAAYGRTQQGFFRNMLGQAKRRVKDFADRGRIKAAVCTLELQDIEKLWEDQHGKCFYSGLSMVIGVSCDWQASLERINPDEGYVQGNVALCCLEFNHTINWSQEKIELMYRLMEDRSDATAGVSFQQPPRTFAKYERVVAENAPGTTKTSS